MKNDMRSTSSCSSGSVLRAFCMSLSLSLPTYTSSGVLGSVRLGPSSSASKDGCRSRRSASTRKLRAIVRHPDPGARIVATKINNVWRFPRDELAAYLLAHENQVQAGPDA